MATNKFDIGLIGLGVMGSNLAINLHRNGFSVIGFDINPKNSFSGSKASVKPSVASRSKSTRTGSSVFMPQRKEASGEHME